LEKVRVMRTRRNSSECVVVVLMEVKFVISKWTSIMSLSR